MGIVMLGVKIVLWIVGVGLFFGAWNSLKQGLKGSGDEYTERAPGVIQSATATAVRLYTIVLRYTVNGRDYTLTVYNQASNSDPVPNNVWRTVRYNPKNPDRATILPADGIDMGKVLGFGAGVALCFYIAHVI